MHLRGFLTKEKLHAFSIHLGISLVIFIVILYFILYEWYPQPLFATDGGWQGIQIIAFVDIVLGPLLTFVVYKKGKKKLIVDLWIIGIIQFSALISGIIVVYNEHPVAIIIMNNRLHPITAYQVNETGMKTSYLKQYSDHHPPIIYSNLPTDIDELNKLSKESLRLDRGLRLFSRFYEKLSNLNKSNVIKKSMLLKSFIDDNPKYKPVYLQFLNNNKGNLNNLIYLPLYSRYEYGIAVLNKESFEIITVLDIFPPGMGYEFAIIGEK